MMRNRTEDKYGKYRHRFIVATKQLVKEGISTNEIRVDAFDTPRQSISLHLSRPHVISTVTYRLSLIKSSVVVSFCSSMISYDLYMFLLQGSREHFRLGLTEEVGSFVWFAIRISQQIFFSKSPSPFPFSFFFSLTRIDFAFTYV